MAPFSLNATGVLIPAHHSVYRIWATWIQVLTPAAPILLTVGRKALSSPSSCSTCRRAFLTFRTFIWALPQVYAQRHQQHSIPLIIFLTSPGCSFPVPLYTCVTLHGKLRITISYPAETMSREWTERLANDFIARLCQDL